MTDQANPRAERGPRERIVFSAAQLIRERGVSGISLRDVVAHAQAPWGSLQHYSRQDVEPLDTVVSELTPLLDAALDRPAPGSPRRPHLPGCAGVAPGDAEDLVARLAAVPWLARALDAVRASGLPDAWIGAGAIRDVIWGELDGGFDAATVRDVDVAFFDPEDLSRERDELAERRLRSLADLPWEATNQAAVHTWYHSYFGGPLVPAFASVHDAVATWPETATCVAVRCTGRLVDVCAPLGLADLLAGVWRRNPARVGAAQSLARLERQDVARKFPSVRIVPP